jgi:secreted Zn-dependent insulinase-like peptidase
MRCKIQTTDCNFPVNTESLIFSMMWVNMLNEHHRELNYMAQLSGITSQIAPRADHILITFDSYNDSVENYVGKFFESLQTFEPEETYFENIKDQ